MGATTVFGSKNFSHEKVISMRSADNTRIVVNIQADDTLQKQFEFFMGVDTISMVESQFGRMRREELEHNILRQKKADGPKSNEHEDFSFTTLDNHLTVYYSA